MPFTIMTKEELKANKKEIKAAEKEPKQKEKEAKKQEEDGQSHQRHALQCRLMVYCIADGTLQRKT